VTEPTPTAEASDLVPPEPQPQPELPPVPAEPAPPPVTAIPGDRLGIPVGATRVIADYGRPRPSYVFLALVSILSLAADIASKSWAERHLDGYPGTVEIWKNHVTLLLAKNRGGAWGLLQSTSENVRRPFFLLVSVAAIAFIMTLYRRLQGRQRALKWGLPLVLGGALGNVFDRIRYGHVIDFIDVHLIYKGIEHHWPTFNIADVAICVGVGLMAIDMFTSKRGRPAALRAPHVPPAQAGEPAADWNGALAEAPPVEPAAAEPVAPEAPVEAAPAASPEVAAAAPPDAPPAEAPPKE
jgi:lipoprotein signal peptidase